MKRRGRGQKLKSSLADFFDFPRDIMLDLSRLILIGNRQVYLENHQGIIEYEEKRIKVKTSSGVLIIKGENLTIRSLYTKELAVEGEIASLEIER